MRRTTRTLALAGMLTALAAFGGCGVTGGGTGGVTTPTASATILQGQVTVTLGKAQFAPQEAITVHINNGLSENIFVADHQTSCSLVTIELQSASGWRAMAPCRVMTPTRLVEIKAGTTNTQQVMASGQPPAWPAGTYRVRLAYSLQRLGYATIVYSGTFTVA